MLIFKFEAILNNLVQKTSDLKHCLSWIKDGKGNNCDYCSFIDVIFSLKLKIIIISIKKNVKTML